MSQKYDQYLQEHKENVYKGFEYIRDNLPELLTEDITEWQYRFGHDLSKSDPEEYDMTHISMEEIDLTKL